MNRFLFPVYRIVVPKPVRTFILKKDLRKKILKHFASLQPGDISSEHREVIEYLEKNELTIFPYAFSAAYSPEKIEVFTDPDNKLPYVIQEGRRLYFKRRWPANRIRRAYADLSREQDPMSPHRYLSETFAIGDTDSLADIGAAEGNFALSVIEKIRKLYLVEYDQEWVEALNATFAPWKDKVVIIGKYLSDTDDERNMKMDSLLAMHPGISFIKIDVDGFEQKVLNGSAKTLSGVSPLKIALCTYHKNDDEAVFTRILENNGFSVTPSRGYMIHYYDKKIKNPWLRRGLIRAVK